MVERFHGRVQREVLGITVGSHRDLERLLAGFSSAYNARRQRVPGGRSPEAVVRERLGRDTSLANPGFRPPPDPCVLPKAMLVVERAKDVSQPDSHSCRPGGHASPLGESRFIRSLVSNGLQISDFTRGFEKWPKSSLELGMIC